MNLILSIIKIKQYEWLRLNPSKKSKSMSKKEIEQATPEDIKKFLEGHDDEKYITSIELNQTGDWSVDETNRVYIVIDDPKKGKKIKTQKFTPFCWTKSLRGSGFYDDDLDKITEYAKKFGIYTEKLETGDNERLEDGYKYIVKTTGTYRNLVDFLKLSSNSITSRTIHDSNW
jgi:hypothetical protein